MARPITYVKNFELVINDDTLQAIKTVTTTAATLFAGSAIMNGREYLEVTPISGTIYWGLTSAVTVATGNPIAAGDSKLFTFETPGTKNVYFVAASSVTCGVVEGRQTI